MAASGLLSHCSTAACCCSGNFSRDLSLKRQLHIDKNNARSGRPNTRLDASVAHIFAGKASSEDIWSGHILITSPTVTKFQATLPSWPTATAAITTLRAAVLPTYPAHESPAATSVSVMSTVKSPLRVVRRPPSVRSTAFGPLALSMHSLKRGCASLHAVAKALTDSGHTSANLKRLCCKPNTRSPSSSASTTPNACKMLDTPIKRATPCLVICINAQSFAPPEAAATRAASCKVLNTSSAE